MSGFIVELWNLKFENSIMDIKKVSLMKTNIFCHCLQ